MKKERVCHGIVLHLKQAPERTTGVTVFADDPTVARCGRDVELLRQQEAETGGI